MNFEKYFPAFKKNIGSDISDLISNFDFDTKDHNFEFYTEMSSVNSAQIEGNSLDLNSFLNQKAADKKFRSKDFDEVSDLVEAYKIAQNSKLTEENFLQAHKISTKHILGKSGQGKYRNSPVGIFDKNGLVYIAVEPEFVKERMLEFCAELTRYLKEDLSEEKVFFVASFLHLRFAHIHPFVDGNGRLARLIEKWFLAEKLGKKFWLIPSEKFYFEHRADYYQKIALGVNFYELDYSKSEIFLKMLVDCLD